VLRGGNDATTWTTVNGVWPFILNLTNNNAEFGGDVRITGNGHRFCQNSTSTWGGNPGNGEGKLEYHSNRWYVVSGANSTEICRWRQSATDRMVLQNGGILDNFTEMRAPIFVDRDNTAFYLDPAVNCVVNAIGASGLITGRSSAATDVNTANDTGSFSVRGSTTTVASMSFHRTGAFAINMGLGTDNVFRIGGWSASANALTLGSSGVLTALADMRAPIFYDSANTGRFLDPGGSTSLSLAGSITMDGAITAGGNITAFSDIRIKDNIEEIQDALSRISHIRGVTYTRTDLADKDRRYGGLIAQEVEQVLPEAVFDTGKTKSIDYYATIGLLVEAIKELKAEIDELKSR
jgi:hypothetical protein